MARLNTNVHVVGLDEDGNPTGQQATFGPDDQLPDWAVTSISNPDVWAERPRGRVARPPAAGSSSDADTRAAEAEKRAVAAEAELQQLRQQLAAAQGAGNEVVEPPRGGPGSGVDAWRKFLTHQGVEDLPADASREDLVALWDARKLQG
jgi:hypothetical protein